MSSTRGRLGWSAAAILGPQLMQFAGLLVLGRLLTPAEFGAVALVTTITELGTLLLSSGLSSYIVHVGQLRQSVSSTVFWINLALSATIALLVAALSDIFSKLFNNPILMPLVLICAGGFLLNIGATHLGLLQRDYRFRAIAVIDISTMLASQVAAVILALIGWGAYSIVVARLGGQLIQIVMYFVVTRWRPTLAWDRGAARAIWKYARNVLGFNLVNFWSRNFDNFIIARIGGADVLGYYSRAYAIMLLPVSFVAGAIGRVLLPTLARQQDDLVLAMRTWVDYTLLSVLTGLPFVSLFVAEPEQIMLVLLGDQWGEASDFLLVLGLSIVPQLIIRPLGFVFQAVGRTRAQLYIGLVTTSITVSAMLVGALFAGPIGVAAGVTVAYSLHLAIYLAYASLRLQLEVLQLLKPAGRLLAAAVVATGAGFSTSIAAEQLSVSSQLGVVTFTVLATYLLAAFVLARATLLTAFDVLRGRDRYGS